MPLTKLGILYLFAIVGAALGAAFVVIRSTGVTDPNLQYEISLALIVLFIGMFFTKDNILIGFWRRAFWSFIIAAILFVIFRIMDAGVDSIFYLFS